MSSLMPFVQDQQWSDPRFASPLAALQMYQNGVNANWTNANGDAGEQQLGPAAKGGESYQTTAWDTGDKDYGDSAMKAALETAKKYDPNAAIEYYQAGTDDNPQYMARINVDQSKLPKQPGGLSGNNKTTLLSNFVTETNQTPDAGQGPKVWNNDLVGYDKDWGAYTDPLNIKPEKEEWRDVGKWGPLVMSAVIGGAGAGLLSGFGGMSDAVAQGLVSGATGSGLGSAAGAVGAAGAGSSNSTSFLDRLNPSNLISDMQQNLQNPNWWLKTIGKQGLDYYKRNAMTQALRRQQQQYAQYGGGS